MPKARFKLIGRLFRLSAGGLTLIVMWLCQKPGDNLNAMEAATGEEKDRQQKSRSV